MCVCVCLRGSNPLVSLKFSSTDRPTYHGRLELGCPKRAWGFSGPKTPLASTVHHLGRFLVPRHALLVSAAPPPVVTSPPGEMGFVGDTLQSIRSMQVRHVLSQIISLGQ